MPPERVIAVGGSAGAIDALLELIPQLPPRLPAPVLITIHRGSDRPSRLDQVLRRDSLLPVQAARDGEVLAPATIYVAPAGRHLMVDKDTLRVAYGPTENGLRPSIDTMLRSVAAAFGSNGIGVLLSGTSVDGVAGLHALHQNAGTTVVEEPREALFPALPEAARHAFPVDHVVSVSAMPALLDALLGATSGTTVDSLAGPSIEEAAFDSDPATGKPAGDPSQFACPDCGGVLWQLAGAGDIPRFRCRVGHGWNGDALLGAQDRQSEAALWAALRALEEQIELASRMATSHARRGQSRFTDRYARRAHRLGAHAGRLRTLLESMFGEPLRGEPALDYETAANSPAPSEDVDDRANA